MRKLFLQGGVEKDIADEMAKVFGGAHTLMKIGFVTGSAESGAMLRAIGGPLGSLLGGVGGFIAGSKFYDWNNEALTDIYAEVYAKKIGLDDIKDMKGLIDYLKSLNPQQQSAVQRTTQAISEKSHISQLNKISALPASTTKLSPQQKQTLNKFLSAAGIQKKELDKSTQQVLAQVLEQQQKSAIYLMQQRQWQIEGYAHFKQFVNTTYDFASSIKELGGLAKCKELERIGDIATKSMTLSKEALKVGELLKIDMPAMLGGLGQAFSGITSFLGTAFPVVSGIVSVFSVFRSVFGRKKSGGSGGNNGIAQALQAIFNQLVELRKEIHELRREVQEFRMEVLDKLIEISQYLANDFKAPVMAELQIIKDDLQFISNYLTGFFGVNKFNDLEKSILLIEKNIRLERYNQSEDLVTKLGSDLATEATSSNHNGGTVFNSFVAGASFYRQTNEMLKRDFVSPNIHFGFLYQLYQRERQPDKLTVQANNLPNLAMFNYLLNNYLKFTAQPKLTHLITPEELQKFKEISIAVKTFIQTLRQDEQFIPQLEAKYKETLADIERVVNAKISNMDSSNPQTTVADIFQGKGTEKNDLDPLLAKADYYQSLIYIFSLLTGNYAAIIRNQPIFETQPIIQKYPVLRQIPAATPDELDDYLHTHPAYYETLQVGKFTQDGVEKIYLAVRDKDGLDLKFYDPNTNEWEQAPRGPLWSDAAGFKDCCYYQTLRSTVATVDGEDRIYFLMRRNDALSLHFYSIQQQRWSQSTTTDFCNNPGWNVEKYSLPIKLVTTFSQTLVIQCFVGNNISYKAHDSQKNIWKPLVTVPWSNNDNNFHTISSYGAYKIYPSKINNDTVVMSARYTDGRQFFTEIFPQNWKHLTINNPKINTANYHINPSFYKVSEMALLKINDATEYFYFLHRKKEGLIVSRVIDLYQPNRRYDQTSNDLEAFSDVHGFNQENNAASIKMLPVTLGNQQKLLVMGQSKQGFIMYAVDPISLKWQALPISNVFSTQDANGNPVDLKSAAESLRAISVTLKDGSQELFLAAITHEGLINYRYPLSIKPLINYLNNTLPIADALVNTETVSPIEEQVDAIIEKLDQRIAEKNNPSVQTENQSSAQDTEAVCIDGECSPSTKRKFETQNNAGLRYSFELETEKHSSQTSNSNQLKPGLLSALSTAAYSLFQWIPRSVPTFVKPTLQLETQKTQLDSKQTTRFIHSGARATQTNSVISNCVLVYDTDNHAHVFCANSQFQTHTVFNPTCDLGKTTAENYTSCRPIEYFGRPSVVCESKNSTIVYTPVIQPRPFENAYGQIALGAVVLHWITGGISFISVSWKNENQQNPVYVNETRFKQKTQQFAQHLDELKLILQTYKQHVSSKKMIEDINWLLSSVDDCSLELKQLLRQDKATQKELHEIGLDIAAIHRAVLSYEKFEPENFVNPTDVELKNVTTPNATSCHASFFTPTVAQCVVIPNTQSEFAKVLR